MIHSRYLFQWKTKIQPWIHREKLPTWFSNCNLGYLIGKLVYGIPVQPRCINPHFVQGAKQNTSYHHSAHRPGIYPGSQTLIRLHDQHCRPVPWPRKSHLQGNQYRLQAWIYCPVQFCLFLLGILPVSSILCPQDIWDGMKEVFSQLFLRGLFPAGFFNSLHKESREASLWNKPASQDFKADSTDSYCILKNWPFPGLTQQPIGTVLVLLCNINIPLQTPTS